jgi:hypothetical protein
MNRLKTQKEKQLAHFQKMNEIYKKESLDFKWFFIIMISALVLTALIENI